MSRHVEHPEAHVARIQARVAEQNKRIREKCATPGFGYVVLMYRRYGLGSTRYDVETYVEAKAIVDREIGNPDYEGGALILQKSYNPDMMIGGQDGASRHFEGGFQSAGGGRDAHADHDDDLIDRDDELYLQDDDDDLR